MSEELGDLQASPDEEIRRLTELSRTGYLHARDDRTSKREIECLECEDKSKFLRTKIESMEVAFADRCEVKSNLEKRLDALSERRGFEGTRRLD